MKNKDKILSVVVPVFNSGRTIKELHKRLKATLEKIVGEGYEIIFVNDGSSDNSWEFIRKLLIEEPNIVAINLMRNFGQHNALMCGLSRSSGKYVVTLDDDLQIPPEEIAKLYNEIQNGYDVVYGIYDTKRHSKYRNIGSELVQFVYRKTFNIDLRITSFRIVEQHVVSSIVSYDKSFTYIDGLISWFTDKIGNVYVKHHPRMEGVSGYTLRKLLVLALNMMTNFSIVPLQVASLVGLIFAFGGFSLGAYFFLTKIFFGIEVSGFTSIIVAVTIFSGVQLLTIGTLGEYIGRIHINISKRPQYAIRDISLSCDGNTAAQEPMENGDLTKIEQM